MSSDSKNIGKEVMEMKAAVEAPPIRSVPTGRNGRVDCAGGCGTRVLKALGECRKCKKARLRAGLKHILKMKKVTA